MDSCQDNLVYILSIVRKGINSLARKDLIETLSKLGIPQSNQNTKRLSNSVTQVVLSRLLDELSQSQIYAVFEDVGLQQVKPNRRIGAFKSYFAKNLSLQDSLLDLLANKLENTTNVKV